MAAASIGASCRLEDATVQLHAAEPWQTTAEQSKLCIFTSDTGKPCVTLNKNLLNEDIIQTSKLLKGMLEEYSGTEVQLDIPFTHQAMLRWISVSAGGCLQCDTVLQALEVSPLC